MRRFGVLVISHGSRSEAWVRLVDDCIAAAQVPAGVPVMSSFLEIVEGRLIQDGIDVLEAQGVTDIVVVPLFVSSGSTHVDEIRWALGVQETAGTETELPRFAVRAKVHCLEPINDDPEIVRIMYEKLQPLSQDPAREIVLVIGHGSIVKGFHLRWRRMLERVAAQLQQLGGFAEADYAMLLPDQVPRKLAWWKKHRPDCDVVIAPLFLSEGYFTEKVLPVRLAGAEVRYHGRTLLPHAGVTEWMERRLDEFWQLCQTIDD